MAGNRASPKAKSKDVFGQARRQSKLFGAGIYARVSTNDQQTLAMRIRAMQEYVSRRGWTIALQVREVNSGVARRQAREKALQAPRRREIEAVLVWRFDRWGRSVTALLTTLQELEHLGVGFVSLTEALDLTRPDQPVGQWLPCSSLLPPMNGRFCGNELGLAWRTPDRAANGSAGQQPRPHMLRSAFLSSFHSSSEKGHPVGWR